MKILAAEFIRSCAHPSQFPQGDLPEVAFVGRSNVGKSSLINALIQRKGLAKVSRTPGKTRMVNIFSVRTDDAMLPRVLLVDLPGYGYAKVSKSIRTQWSSLLEQYFDRRTQVRAVVLLVESRVIGAHDQETLHWLTSIGHPPIVVATKVDKLKPSERVAALRRRGEELGLPGVGAFMAFSSVTGEGRNRLWTAITERTRI